MPVYDITDPKTGRSVSLQGDSPPTEQELEQVFSEVERRSMPKLGLGELYLSQAEFEQQDIKPIQLPIYGEPGSYTRGASRALSKLVESSTTPEGIALGTALMIPGVGPVLATVMGAAAVKQAAQLAGEAAGKGGDKEMAGEAAVLAAIGGAGMALPIAHIGAAPVTPELVGKAGEAIGRRLAPLEEPPKVSTEILKTEAPLTAAEVAKEGPEAKPEPQAPVSPEPAPAPETPPVSAPEAKAPEPTPPSRDWDSYYEDLVGDLDSFAPARQTGRASYEMDDVAQRFVDYAKKDKTGKPLPDLVKDFAKQDEASTSQIRKLHASVNSLEPTPPAKVEAPAEKPLKVGDEINLMGYDQALVDSQTLEGTRYEIFGSASLKNKVAVVRVTDVETGETTTLKAYPDYEAAAKDYSDAIKAEGGTVPPRAAPKAAAKPAAETGKEMGEPAQTKAQLVDEILGPKPLQNVANVTARVRWEADAKDLLKRSKEELQSIAADKRTADVREAEIAEATKVIIPEVQKIADEAKGTWRTALRSKADKEGVRFPTAKGLTKGDAVYQVSRSIAERRRIAQSKPPETPPTGPGIVGMGGAVPTEFEPGGSAAIDIYGIAQRVREARAKAGQVAPVEPGVGTNPIDSVQRGQELLSRGVDPEKALSNFESTGRFSADDIAVTRAHGEQLTKAAERTAEKFGTESQEYLNAWTKLSEWDRRTKPMNTEWQKMGVAQQGATDIDTGSYTSLQRAFGETFTKDQSAAAHRHVEATKKAEAEASTAKADLAKALADLEKAQAAKPRFSDYVLKVAEKWVNQWGKEADVARKALAGKFLSPSPEDLLNLAKIARYDIAQIGLDFAKWSDKMVQEFGPKVQPYLADAWRKGQELIDAMAATIKSPTTRKQVKSAVTKAQDPVRKLWQQAKDYIDHGETDPETVFSKLAVDTGIPRDQVREMLTKPKSVKRVSDEMYRKMADRRRVVNSAKAWLEYEKMPRWERFVRSVPRIFFIDKIAGHGAVGMITHAGINMFDPRAWKVYFPNFFRQIPLAFSKAYHERMMLDLTKDPNFITARRAGLVNDPWRYADDYQNIAMKKFFGKFSRLIGGEGFDALKLFRQARFNQEWNALPESLKTPEMATFLARGINYATGVVKGRVGGETAATWLFAPKLEASRWAWTFGDTARILRTAVDWKKASAEQRALAMIDLKEKVRVAGTYLGLLVLNEGVLQMVNSDQHINFTDPTKADFLSFKVAGHKVGIIGPMIGIARLLGGVLKHAIIPQHEMRPGEKVSGRAAEIYRDVGSYARGKLSPFGGQVANVVFQSDYAERPLPWSSDRAKRYLERQGRGQYTYPEYFLQELTPIPASEVVREIWASQGMDETAIKKGMKALTVGAVAITGARISKDYSAEHPYAR